MPRTLMVGSEAAPFVKTGGLADVLGGLPPALAALGEQVAVLLPKYRAIELSKADRVYHQLPVWVGTHQFNCAIDRAIYKGVPYFFVDAPALFDREGIYNVGGHDYDDNHLRFALLSRAALEVSRRIFRADIFHCHDWQAGLLPLYLRRFGNSDPTFIGCRTALTIHNLGYQGRFNPWILGDVGLDLSFMREDLVEFHGDVNFLKAGLVYTDAITTVSQAYAREIQTPEYGFGLEGLLRARSASLTGILNGVDYGDWNPETDRLIPARYSATDLSGKAICKQAILEHFHLSPGNAGRPLLGIVSRFATQKGFDLIADIAGQLLQEDVSLMVLGSGESRYEEMFRALAHNHPDRVAVYFGYNNNLAHLIEAGSDIFLMPSLYEPCGLNQIYSLRYGTVPVVRATGGLDDTIDEETGFKFHPYAGWALLDAIRAALGAYRQPESWRAMMRRGMARDFSWTVSARAYAALYQRLRAA